MIHGQKDSANALSEDPLKDQTCADQISILSRWCCGKIDTGMLRTSDIVAQNDGDRISRLVYRTAMTSGIVNSPQFHPDPIEAVVRGRKFRVGFVPLDSIPPAGGADHPTIRCVNAVLTII